MCAKCKEALEILTAEFGKKHAGYLLWNETCFPMDGEIALKQARELVERSKKAKAATSPKVRP